MASSVVPISQARRRRAPVLAEDRDRERERWNGQIIERQRVENGELREKVEQLQRELAHIWRDTARERRRADDAPDLAALKGRLRAAGVSQEAVARAAAVTKTMVCHVLAGRATSRRIIETAERLLADVANLATYPDKTDGSVPVSSTQPGQGKASSRREVGGHGSQP